MSDGPNLAPDATDKLAAQVASLWRVLRAFAATHPDLPALIEELSKVERAQETAAVAWPISDDAIELAHAMLREMIESLEKVRKDRLKL